VIIERKGEVRILYESCDKLVRVRAAGYLVNHLDFLADFFWQGSILFQVTLGPLVMVYLISLL